MEYRQLGKTGIYVSRLCFGSLTIGPAQSNLSIDDGAEVILKAFDCGVNFIDTAKLYKTYGYIKRALEISKKQNIVISSRSYDYTYDGMKKSLDEALHALSAKSIDIFGLHEQEDVYTLKGHHDAIRCLMDAKKEGKIKAISISTHNIKAVEAASIMPEIDVIFPLLNYKGIGIGDGDAKGMENAIHKAKLNGKGIYTMKPIGGGNLIGEVEKSLKYVIDNQDIDSIAVGMQSENEVIANSMVFEGKEVPSDIKKTLRNTKRRLLIDWWCEGCGKCVERCSMGALKIVNGKSCVNPDLCRLCGYCSTVCPQFCIKII
ncbi:MAG TPA: aldo/keto reductase [Clostridiaceae bacterium]|nr:aldo/keto reductase [Clostridiaceae bacterium]